MARFKIIISSDDPTRTESPFFYRSPENPDSALFLVELVERLDEFVDFFVRHLRESAHSTLFFKRDPATSPTAFRLQVEVRSFPQTTKV